MGARADPQYYLDYLTAWAQDSKPVRLVITGTEVNALVYLEEVTQGEQSCTIVRGDNLSIICRRYYGRSTARYYNALAQFNGIKNPHLIYPGTTIRIPPESVLWQFELSSNNF